MTLPITEIVDVTISVSSSAITRKGFNSILIASHEDQFATETYTLLITWDSIPDPGDIFRYQKTGSGNSDSAVNPDFATWLPNIAESMRTDTGVCQPGATAEVNVVARTILLTGLINANPFNIEPEMATGPASVTNVFDTLPFTIKPYTSYADVVADPDVIGAEVLAAASAAFSQIPSVPTVYIGNYGDGTDITNQLTAMAFEYDFFGVTQVMAESEADQTWDDVGEEMGTWCAANKKYGFMRTKQSAAKTDATNFNSWHRHGSQPLHVAIASRCLSQTPGSWTAAYKTLEGIDAESYSSAEIQTMKDNRINWYTSTAGRSFSFQGVTASIGFIDTYVGALYLEARMEEDVFAYMVSVEKVPYTNDGINAVVNQVDARLRQSVIDGYLANDPAYTISAPLASEVPAADKSNRLLPDITFQAVTAGAIHKVLINGTVVA